MDMSNKVYDFLNVMVRYILPAAGTAYFGLSDIWNLPNALEVVGTISVLCTFLGVIIAFARKGWKTDDELVIDARDPDAMAFGFESGLAIENLKDGQTLSLNVKKIEE